jgi:hypothetical protein
VRALCVAPVASSNNINNNINKNSPATPPARCRWAQLFHLSGSAAPALHADVRAQVGSSCTLHWGPYPNVSACGIAMAPPEIVGKIEALLGPRRAAEFERLGCAQDFAAVVTGSAALWLTIQELRAAALPLGLPARGGAGADEYVAAAEYVEEARAARAAAAWAVLEGMERAEDPPPGGFNAILARLLVGKRLLPRLPHGGDLAAVVAHVAAAETELWEALRAQSAADAALLTSLKKRYDELVSESAAAPCPPFSRGRWAAPGVAPTCFSFFLVLFLLPAPLPSPCSYPSSPRALSGAPPLAPSPLPFAVAQAGGGGAAPRRAGGLPAGAAAGGAGAADDHEAARGSFNWEALVVNAARSVSRRAFVAAPPLPALLRLC